MSDTLTTEQQETFKRDGYLVFEPFLDDAEIAVLKGAIDELGSAREKQRAGEQIDVKYAFEIPALGELVRHPRMMAIIEGLMGPDFALHHLHAIRQDAGAHGVNWHHDYEQFPQTNRSHTMVHVFYYLNGLNGEVGDLLVLPGSHGTVCDRSAMHMFGQSDLPKSLTVDNIAPGTAIVVHSALWHARRAKPGGENRPRYFADASYCQAGIVWPGYGNYADVYRRAEASGLATGERGHLFSEEMFFDTGAVRDLLSGRQGSLVTALPGWGGTK